MHSAFLRLLDTVRVMPIGEWISTAEIHAALEKRGHIIHRRSVQRDLLSLADEIGGIESANVVCKNETIWKRTKPLE